MSNSNYLKNFFAETNKIDRAEGFSVEGSGEIIHAHLSYGDVIDAVMTAPTSEQQSIAAMIRRIDFANGDLSHYLRHLGTCMVRVSAGGN